MLGVQLGAGAVMLALVGIVIFALAVLLIHFTAFGRQMTASGQNPLLAGLGGISVHRSNAIAWAAGGALAAVAGNSFGAANDPRGACRW